MPVKFCDGKPKFCEGKPAFGECGPVAAGCCPDTREITLGGLQGVLSYFNGTHTLNRSGPADYNGLGCFYELTFHLTEEEVTTLCSCCGDPWPAQFDMSIAVDESGIAEFLLSSAWYNDGAQYRRDGWPYPESVGITKHHDWYDCTLPGMVYELDNWELDVVPADNIIPCTEICECAFVKLTWNGGGANRDGLLCCDDYWGGNECIALERVGDPHAPIDLDDDAMPPTGHEDNNDCCQWYNLSGASPFCDFPSNALRLYLCDDPEDGWVSWIKFEETDTGGGHWFKKIHGATKPVAGVVYTANFLETIEVPGGESPWTDSCDLTGTSVNFEFCAECDP